MNKKSATIALSALALVAITAGATPAQASTTPVTNTYACAPYPGGSEICVGVDHVGSWVEDAQVQLYYPGRLSGVTYFIEGQDGWNAAAGGPTYKYWTPTPQQVSGSGWLPQGNVNVRTNNPGQWCGIAEDPPVNGYYVTACVTI